MGATSNPAIVANVIKQESKIHGKYLEQLFAENQNGSEEEITWKMIEKIEIDATHLLRPAFEKSNGREGRLSLQVNPVFYRDPQKMVEHGIYLSSLALNITIKARCIAAGLVALEEMTAKGIIINGTVSFTVAQAIACAEY